MNFMQMLIFQNEITRRKYSTDHTFVVNATIVFLMCKDSYLHSVGKSQDPETSIRMKPKKKENVKQVLGHDKE